jgi:AcrR family transcriptional regulator
VPAVAAARSPRQTLTQLRRAEILAAATKVFGKKSFAGTRMDDIATAAGIAKGTLYLYFGSKEEIYAAAIQAGVAQMHSLVAEKLLNVGGVRERLSVAIGVRMKFWGEQQALYQLLLTVGREARHRRQTAELMRSGQRSFLAIIEDGVKAGELPPGEYCNISWAILDLVRGYNERRLDKLSTTTPEQDAEFITASSLAMLGL